MDVEFEILEKMSKEIDLPMQPYLNKSTWLFQDSINGYSYYERCTFQWTRRQIFSFFQSKVEWLKPLRMTVKKISRINFTQNKGCFISAVIETGVFIQRYVRKILVVPPNMTFSIFVVRHNAEVVEFGRPGDLLEFEIFDDDCKDFSLIAKGDVICSARSPVRQIKR
jgi:translation elongation factor EF-1alpha